MPTVPAMAEPDMPVVRPAHNVVLVGRSIFVHAGVFADMRTAIDLGGASIVMTSAMMTFTMMTPTMMTPTMMASTVMASTVLASTLRISASRDSKSERCTDRKDERNLL